MAPRRSNRTTWPRDHYRFEACTPHQRSSSGHQTTSAPGCWVCQQMRKVKLRFQKPFLAADSVAELVNVQLELEFWMFYSEKSTEIICEAMVFFESSDLLKSCSSLMLNLAVCSVAGKINKLNPLRIQFTRCITKKVARHRMPRKRAAFLSSTDHSHTARCIAGCLATPLARPHRNPCAYHHPTGRWEGEVRRPWSGAMRGPSRRTRERAARALRTPPPTQSPTTTHIPEPRLHKTSAVNREYQPANPLQFRRPPAPAHISGGEHPPNLTVLRKILCEVCRARVAGTPRDRSSICEQRDNCPALTYGKHFFWWLRTSNVNKRNFASKTDVAAHSSLCHLANEKKKATKDQGSMVCIGQKHMMS